MFLVGLVGLVLYLLGALQSVLGGAEVYQEGVADGHDHRAPWALTTEITRLNAHGGGLGPGFVFSIMRENWWMSVKMMAERR
jgi:hypothetical protein